jgi:hypothetical protein
MDEDLVALPLKISRDGEERRGAILLAVAVMSFLPGTQLDPAG